MKVTVALTEPLGAEVLVYFSTDATGVASSAVEADAGEDADVRLGGDDGDEEARHDLGARQPSHDIAIGQHDRARGPHEPPLFFAPGTRGAPLALNGACGESREDPLL